MYSFSTLVRDSSSPAVDIFVKNLYKWEGTRDCGIRSKLILQKFLIAGTSLDGFFFLLPFPVFFLPPLSLALTVHRRPPTLLAPFAKIARLTFSMSLPFLFLWIGASRNAFSRVENRVGTRKLIKASRSPVAVHPRHEKARRGKLTRRRDPESERRRCECYIGGVLSRQCNCNYR